MYISYLILITAELAKIFRVELRDVMIFYSCNFKVKEKPWLQNNVIFRLFHGQVDRNGRVWQAEASRR